MAYATRTSVPVAHSQEEIRRTIARYGATGFVFGEASGHGLVLFEIANRRIKIALPLPKADDRSFDQKRRSRWRCLLLVIKAKLEAVSSGITTVEQEFMAHIVLPNGKVLGQEILPQIEESYRGGKMPPLLT